MDRIDRRALLRGGGPLLVGALAGCLGTGAGNGDGGGDGTDDDGASPSTDRPPSPTDPSPTPDPTSTSEPTPSPTATPGGSRLVDRSFEVRDVECGTDRDAAAATVDGARVTVTGTITGSDSCHTARLADVTYAGADGRLRIAVESYVPESTGTAACAQCLVEIDYEATFAFEGGPPGTVVVVHDGQEIASIALSG